MRHLMMLFAFAVCGCGGESFSTLSLTGNVTVDGQAVSQGTINFVPQAAGQGPSTTAPIAGGKYHADVPMGMVHVYFQATRATGKMIDVFGTPQLERVSAIPPSYTGGVELEVTAQTLQHDFSLTTNK